MGRDNSPEKISEVAVMDKDKAIVMGRNFRDTLHESSGKQSNISFSNSQSNQTSNNLNRPNRSGLDQEKLDGLNIKERKRRNSGSNFFTPTSTDIKLGNKIDGDTTMESALSTIDFADLTTIKMAQSATKTSQPK